MVSQVTFLSSRKGSNPGGNCFYSSDRLSFDAYIKYCFGSHIHGVTAFKAEHQPIYESITFELARKMGLKTVDSFLLLNKAQKVQFLGWKKHGENDPLGRDYYFINRLTQNLNINRADISVSSKCEIPEGEFVYLDSLLISDVVGKKQNYIIDQSVSLQPIYIDLGCSFVHAHDGFIHHPHRLKLTNSRDFRRACKKLEGISVIGADNQIVVDLEEFINLPYSMEINCLNPWSFVKLSSLIGKDELDEIQRHLVDALYKNLPKFKKLDLVI